MRRADASDRSQLERLVSIGLVELEQGRGGLAYVQDLTEHLGVVREDLAEALVNATIDGGIVAETGFGVVVDKLALIYVSPHARRTRVGTAIYKDLLTQGPIELWAKPGDRTAKSFAESLGLKARLLIMSGELSSNDES